MKASHFVVFVAAMGSLALVNTLVGKETGREAKPSETAWNILLEDAVESKTAKEFVPAD